MSLFVNMFLRPFGSCVLTVASATLRDVERQALTRVLCLYLLICYYVFKHYSALLQRYSNITSPPKNYKESSIQLYTEKEVASRLPLLIFAELDI